MSRAVSGFIDMARWMAALLVTFFHTQNAFVNHADIMSAPHGPLEYVWWFFAAFPFAHGAVVVFFVLSGFLVGGGLIEKARAGRPFLRTYVIDRTARIYIVLVPALALTLVLDAVGRAFFPHPNLADLLTQARDPTTFLLNLASLQGVWFAPFGSNTPLWSLGMEFWYYVAAGLLALIVAPAYARSWRALGGGAALLLLLALAAGGSYFLYGFALWSLGALARIAPRPVMRARWVALALWLAVVVVLRLTVRLPGADLFPAKYLVDTINAALFANLLLTLRFDASDGFAWAKPGFHRAFADFSFTLYAIHMPALAWISGAIALLLGLTWREHLATLPHYLVTLATLAALVALAYALSRVTEARTLVVRNWARRIVPGG